MQFRQFFIMILKLKGATPIPAHASLMAFLVNTSSNTRRKSVRKLAMVFFRPASTFFRLLCWPMAFLAAL